MALELLGQRARAFHETGEPFAMMLSCNPPHPPFHELPDRYREPYRDTPAADLLTRPNVDTSTAEGGEAAAVVADYFAAITGVDEQVGRLMAVLDDLDLAEDTLVVFTSDHGMQLGSHGLLAKNVWFDESLLVLLLVRQPGRIRAGTDDVLYVRAPSTAGGEDWRGWRTPERMLLCHHGTGGTEPVHLYDLVADPYQRCDVLTERPEEAARLVRELRAELHRVGDPWAEAPRADATATGSIRTDGRTGGARTENARAEGPR